MVAGLYKEDAVVRVVPFVDVDMRLPDLWGGGEPAETTLYAPAAAKPPETELRAAVTATGSAASCGCCARPAGSSGVDSGLVCHPEGLNPHPNLPPIKGEGTCGDDHLQEKT